MVDESVQLKNGTLCSLRRPTAAAVVDDPFKQVYPQTDQ